MAPRRSAAAKANSVANVQKEKKVETTKKIVKGRAAKLERKKDAEISAKKTEVVPSAKKVIPSKVEPIKSNETEEEPDDDLAQEDLNSASGEADSKDELDVAEEDDDADETEDDGPIDRETVEAEDDDEKEDEEELDGEEEFDSEVEAGEYIGLHGEKSDDEEVEAEEDEDEDDKASADDEEKEFDYEEDDGANDDDSRDEDDEPIELPIVKKEIKKDGSKQIISYGRVSLDVPKARQIFVKVQSKAVNQIELVNVFAKYGTITNINIRRSLTASTILIVFETAESAQAALNEDKTAKIKGNEISVQPVNEKFFHGQFIDEFERTIIVGCITPSTTKEQLQAHFEKCGEIVKINLFDDKVHTFQFIVFKSKESLPAALKLNGTVIDSSNITVRLKARVEPAKTPIRTVTIANTQDHKSFDVKKLEKICKKYGEIEDVLLICSKKVLGFVTYKDEASAKNLLAQNGTVVDGLELNVHQYRTSGSHNNTICVTNLIPGVTVEDIQQLFGAAGEIENINLQPKFAHIAFKTIDGYINSFIFTESKILGKTIYIEPFSKSKLMYLKQKRTFSTKKTFAPNIKGNLKTGPRFKATIQSGAKKPFKTNFKPSKNCNPHNANHNFQSTKPNLNRPNVNFSPNSNFKPRILNANRPYKNPNAERPMNPNFTPKKNFTPKPGFQPNNKNNKTANASPTDSSKSHKVGNNPQQQPNQQQPPFAGQKRPQGQHQQKQKQFAKRQRQA